MSSLIVDVCEIADVEEHTNANALEIALVKGWKCVVRKGEFQPGDKVVYFPVDTVLPVELSDRIGVTKYLSKGRIRAAKLRGFISCGLIIACEDSSWEVGRNLAEHYGATKWEPPEIHDCGDAERDHSLFYHYTDLENIRNFPDVLQVGEEVVITEKIHGTNSRCGHIQGHLMAGSHTQRRKRPENDEFAKSLYWLPVADENFAAMLEQTNSSDLVDVIAYAEIFGDGVQDLRYGMTKGKKAYRIFDFMQDGKFVGFDKLEHLCRLFDVPMAPVLYRGPWKPELLELAEGKSEIAHDQIREGIVIKPVEERWDHGVGRVIMKCLSKEYLIRKGGTERH